MGCVPSRLTASQGTVSLLRTACFGLITVLALTSVARLGFAWGPEGHQVIALIAQHYMTDAAKAKARELLHGDSIESVADWADDYSHQRRETEPWHYINTPISALGIDMARDCPQGDCVVAKTEQYIAVLRDSRATPAARAEALKFVVHFVGDLHQPLHVADNDDRGGNERSVIFDGHPDNLHWVWDTGLLQHAGRDPQELAKGLEQIITAQDVAAWDRGTVEDWANEGHLLAISVAYGGLKGETPAPITIPYEERAQIVVGIQLQKAGVRLAWVLNEALK
jgi:hypothetical protein